MVWKRSKGKTPPFLPFLDYPKPTKNHPQKPSKTISIPNPPKNHPKTPSKTIFIPNQKPSQNPPKSPSTPSNRPHPPPFLLISRVHVAARVHAVAGAISAPQGADGAGRALPGGAGVQRSYHQPAGRGGALHRRTPTEAILKLQYCIFCFLESLSGGECVSEGECSMC